MRVPIAVAEGVDRNEGHAGFDEPPSEQAVAGEWNRSISVADLARFLGQIEGIASGGGSEQVEGAARSVVQIADLGGGGEGGSGPVHVAEQAASVDELRAVHIAHHVGDAAQIERAVERPVERNVERVEGFANAPGVRTEAVEIPEMPKLAERDVWEHGLLRGPQLADHGADRRHIQGCRRWLDSEDGVLRMVVPGEREVGPDGVVVVAVRDRANDGVLLGEFAEPRQMLGDRDAGYGGGGRFEFAANLGRRVGLEVQSFKVRRPAVVEDQNARLRTAEVILGFAGVAGLQQPRQHEPGEAEPADAERFAARDAVAESNAIAEKGEHGLASCAKRFFKCTAGPWQFPECVSLGSLAAERLNHVHR